MSNPRPAAAPPRARPAVRIDPVEPVTVLHTPRMTLRPLAPSDRDRFIRTVRASSDHLEEFSPLRFPGESDRQLFDRQLALTRSGLRSGSALRLAGFAEGRLAGAFNLNSIVRGLTFRADCNWWVSVDFAGRGYATEGLGAAVRHALADLPAGLGLVEVHAYINQQNTPGIRVAQKLGFVRDAQECTRLQLGDRWALHDRWICRA